MTTSAQSSAVAPQRPTTHYEQQELLPDLPVLERAPSQFNKAVAVIHMYPISGGRYGHFARKVYNALLVLALRVWDAMSPSTREQVISQRRVLRFQATVGEIQRIVGTRSKASDRVYRAIDELYRLQCRFDVVDQSDTVWQVSTRLISQWARPKIGTGLVQWEYPPDVFALLMNPKPFSTLSVDLASQLSSGYSLAFYENVYRYINNPSKLTRRMSVEQWVRLIVTTSAAERYKAQGNYRRFKSEVLLPAIEELNTLSICPIAIELIEFRGLRNRITHLQFRLALKAHQKNKDSLAFDLVSDEANVELGLTKDEALQDAQPAVRCEVAAQLLEWGISQSRVDALLSTVERKRLKDLIAQMHQRIKNPGATPIRRIASAFVDAAQKGYNLIDPKNGSDRPQSGVVIDAQIEQQAKDSLQARFERFQSEQAKRFYEAQLPLVQEQLQKAFIAQDADTFVVEQYAKSGLKGMLVSVSFFAWLVKQDGVLSQPHECEVAVFEQWEKENSPSP